MVAPLIASAARTGATTARAARHSLAQASAKQNAGSAARAPNSPVSISQPLTRPGRVPSKQTDRSYASSSIRPPRMLRRVNRDRYNREGSSPQKKAARLRISTITAIFMLIVAMGIDLIQAAVNLLNLIPIVGMVIALIISWCIDVGAWIGFFIWYKMHDVVFMDKASKMLTFGSTLVIECTPFLNALPAWTLSVLLMVYIVRREDVKYNMRTA